MVDDETELVETHFDEVDIHDNDIIDEVDIMVDDGIDEVDDDELEVLDEMHQEVVDDVVENEYVVILVEY